MEVVMVGAGDPDACMIRMLTTHVSSTIPRISDSLVYHPLASNSLYVIILDPT
jgi:hypothetical protein